MTIVTEASLVHLEACYAELLVQAAELADPAETFLASREEFTSKGFVTLDGVLAGDALAALARQLMPFLRPVAERVLMRQVLRADHTLSDGARFWRIDPHTCRDPVIREKLTVLLDRLGFRAFGALLAARLTPMIRRVAGLVTYRRAYFYIYDEGDYISVHDDHHVGSRVDVQFPISFEAAGGIRILRDGFLEMRYDAAGSMNLLGPSVWHDVPPLLRSATGEMPLRVNLGFRFTPDDEPAPAGR